MIKFSTPEVGPEKNKDNVVDPKKSLKELAGQLQKGPAQDKATEAVPQKQATEQSANSPAQISEHLVVDAANRQREQKLANSPNLQNPESPYPRV